MNEEPKSRWKRPVCFPQLVWAWLALTVVISFVDAIVVLGQPGGPHSFLSWLGFVFLVVVVGGIFSAMVLSLYLFIRWLCHWRNLKRALFVLVCLATLIALFYAEEDWRGWHAWSQFKHEWEAKGEHFDFASLVPAPVSEAQNFAMAPVVVGWYGYILNREGQKISPDSRDKNLVNQVSFDLGDNEATFTNTVGDWRKGTVSDLQPWQELYRRLAAKTNLFPVSPRPQAPAADVLLALSRYAGPLEELRQASRLPESRFPLNYDSENPMEILIPHLAPLKRAAIFLRLRALAEIQAGQREQAGADISLALRLNEAIRRDPFRISQLVRMAMIPFVVQPVYEGLAGHQWTEVQLVALNAELGRLDFLADCERTQKAEIAFVGKEIGYLNRHRDLNAMFAGMGMGFSANEEHGFWIFRVIPSGWFFTSARDKCERLMRYFPAVDSAAKTISPQKIQLADKFAKAKASLFDPLDCLDRMFGADIQGYMAPGSFLEKTAYAQTSVDLARTAIALERYRLAHGEYPETLTVLAPQFIAQVPHDVIGGGPLKYRREANGLFTLYSVGWNETDDGGVVVTDDGGVAVYTKDKSPQVDNRQGDWVWRYPAK